MNFPDFGIGDRTSCKILSCLLCLGNQHPKAVLCGNPQLLGIQKQPGSGRIIDQIQNTFQLWEQRKVYGGNTIVGIHSHRCGVDNHGGIRMLVKRLIVVVPRPGNEDGTAAFFLHYGFCHNGGTPGAQNQNLFSGKRYTGTLCHGLKAEVVGIMSQQMPVRPADNGVHGSKALRYRCQFIQKRNYGFFVGNRYIQTGKVSVFQEILQLLRLLFKEAVPVSTQLGVNLGGVAVSQFPA